MSCYWNCRFTDSLTWTIDQFYEGLAKRAATNGHTIDIFAGCLDQIGLLEMKSMVNNTGGFMILADSFNTAIFKQSFQRVFQKDAQGHLQMGFNATLDVQVIKKIKWLDSIDISTHNPIFFALE